MESCRRVGGRARVEEVNQNVPRLGVSRQQPFNLATQGNVAATFMGQKRCPFGCGAARGFVEERSQPFGINHPMLGCVAVYRRALRERP
jgi:hypothetical protein